MSTVVVDILKHVYGAGSRVKSVLAKQYLKMVHTVGSGLPLMFTEPFQT